MRAGRFLVLKEWNPETEKYTGREVKKEVSCVVKSKNLKMFSAEDIEKYGWQVIGFK